MVSVTEKAVVRPSGDGLWERLLLIFYRHESVRGYLLLTPTLLVMLGMMIVPLIGLTVLSFATQIYFQIDYTPTLKNYFAVFNFKENPIYLYLLLKSNIMSWLVTLFVIITAYPMAYFLAFRVRRGKLVWLILITVPFWTSYLLRVFAWKLILGYEGLINSGLKSLSLLTDSLGFLLYNPTSVVITLTHAWAAFAILPIYVSLEKIDRSLLEAATDLGDTPRERFWGITFPLSLPGVVAATLLVYIPTVGDYVTPALVGGPSGIMIGNLIQSLFGKANNAPLGSALSIVMMAAITLVVCLFLGIIGRKRWKRAES
jgi:spermidine/putrescine transport system permease protein